MKTIHGIAVIPGDGIGIEVISEGVKCLKTLSEIFEDLTFELAQTPQTPNRNQFNDAEGCSRICNGLESIKALCRKRRNIRSLLVVLYNEHIATVFKQILQDQQKSLTIKVDMLILLLMKCST